MKKLLLTALGCICACSAYAGSCGNYYIETRGNQHFTDDEFLYDSPRNEMDEIGYECDNEFCGNGTTITMWPGHIYKGQTVDKTITYRCKISMLGDRWEPISEDDSGEIVSDRWCDSNTKEKDLKFFDKKNIPDSLKEQVDAVVENADKVARVLAECTKDGWRFENLSSCKLPYLACGGNCLYYVDIVRQMREEEDYLKDHNGALHQMFGSDEDIMQAYINGTIPGELVDAYIKEDTPLRQFCRTRNKNRD